MNPTAHGGVEGAVVVLKLGAIYQMDNGAILRFIGWSHDEFIFQLFDGDRETMEVARGHANELQQFIRNAGLIRIRDN